MTDLRILLGQRLSVGFDGPTIPDEYRQLIREYKIGNVILFRRNVESYAQLKKLCADLRTLILTETGLPPFIMIDEECGSVSRLAHIAAPTPCAMAIGATNQPENAYRIGKIVGDELHAAGINFNLAPVLDCFTNPDNSVCGNRCFAGDPEKVAQFGLQYIRGLKDAGVIACGKHFPGHGDTAVDSHLDLPVVDKTAQQVRQVELRPFAACIRGGIEAIMSAHVVFPAMEPDRVPATVSRRVMTGLLRQKLGFDGIIVSDGMEMNAVMNLFGIEEGTRRALDAGIDVALICHSAQQAASAGRYLANDCREHPEKRAEIEAHYRRIAACKAQLTANEGSEADFGSDRQRLEARHIMENAIRILHAPEGKPLPELNESTAFFGVPALAATLANDQVFLDAAALCAQAFHGVSGIPGAAPKTAVVFLGRHPDTPRVTEAARKLAQAGTRIIAVSLYTPRCLDFLPDSVWKIAAWQYDRLAVDAVLALLRRHAL